MRIYDVLVALGLASTVTLGAAITANAADFDFDGVDDTADPCVVNLAVAAPTKNVIKLGSMLVAAKGKLQIKLNFIPGTDTNTAAINPNVNGAHVRIADYTGSTDGTAIAELDIPGVELGGPDSNNRRCAEGDGWKAIAPNKVGSETWTYTNVSGLLPGDDGGGTVSCATPISLLGMNPANRSKFKLSIKNAVVKKGYYQVKVSASGLTWPAALSATATLVKSIVSLGSYMETGSPGHYLSAQAQTGQCAEQAFDPQDSANPPPICKKLPTDAVGQLDGLGCTKP